MTKKTFSTDGLFRAQYTFLVAGGVVHRYQCGSRLLADAAKQDQLDDQLRNMLSLLRNEESGICR